MDGALSEERELCVAGIANAANLAGRGDRGAAREERGIGDDDVGG
jgi:hypothetical protein